ncbi:hypothetical protein BCCR75714_07252 (plasmid) [Burkholderia sola]|nr:hypothetical protein BCCR75714_07252 [Burkholderia cenocepacia]
MHTHAESGLPSHCIAQELHGTAFRLVWMHCRVGNPGVIVHCDEQVLPANAVHCIAPIAGDTMARTRDTAKLLDVDVQQIARRLVLVALNRFTRLQVAQPRQSGTHQHPTDGRGRHSHLSSDLTLQQALLAQFHDQ